MDYGESQEITLKRNIMLPFLHEIKNSPYDCLYFLPGKKNSLNVEAAVYKDPGEKIGGSSLGDLYHIILFKDNGETVHNYDFFEAILGCPLEYMSNLLPSGWYGILAKKTTTSDEFIEDMQDMVLNNLTETGNCVTISS